jgi:hypothetical protein
MTGPRGGWPSRAEWQAKAEQSVRTRITMFERIPAGTVFLTADETAEVTALARQAAAQARPLLTAEIQRLRALLPDRPNAGRARVAWFIGLDETRYALACDLAAVEKIRSVTGRAAKAGGWGEVQWQLSRIRRSHRAIRPTPDLDAALDRLDDLTTAEADRRTTYARALEDEAVALEVARRATDEAWTKELEWRASVDSPRIIRVA